MTFEKKLQESKFTVTAEISSPHGTDVSGVLSKASLLRGKVDAINITDNQRAVMRLGPLSLSHLLIEQGIEPIFQITCRDRNRVALQSELLSAHVLGVKNVLALSGDHISFGDHPQAQMVYDLDSVQLLDTISKLNSGTSLSGKPLEGKTDFFAGAAVNPSSDLLDLQILKMEKKIEKGAKFFQTQAIFHPQDFEDFKHRIQDLKTKIIPSVMPLRSLQFASFLNEKVPGIRIPKDDLSRLADSKDQHQTSLEICAEDIKKLKEIADGVHIIHINHEDEIPQILKLAGI